MELACLRHIAAPDVHIVAVECLEDVVEGQAVLDQAPEVDEDVVLPALPAPSVHLRHSGNGAQAGLHDPIVERRQFLEGLPLACHDVVVDLTQPRGNGAHLRAGDPVRQFHDLESLHHELPREVDVGTVIEDHRDL